MSGDVYREENGNPIGPLWEPWRIRRMRLLQMPWTKPEIRQRTRRLMRMLRLMRTRLMLQVPRCHTNSPEFSISSRYVSFFSIFFTYICHILSLYHCIFYFFCPTIIVLAEFLTTYGISGAPRCRWCRWRWCRCSTWGSGGGSCWSGCHGAGSWSGGWYWGNAPWLHRIPLFESFHSSKMTGKWWKMMGIGYNSNGWSL